RKFHIGIAFEFQDFVLSFGTRDLCFQVHWAASLQSLPRPELNVTQDWGSFVILVANWINGLELNDRVAVDVICNAHNIWFGVGVYTSSELFYLAGLSPCLTVAEVFGVPSRCARLIEAYFCHVQNAEDKIWKLVVKPAICESMLAPHQDNRIAFLEHLHVHSKVSSRISDRMADLRDLHMMTTNADEPFYDVYEPSYMARSLVLPGHLGHLIFGDLKWQALCPVMPHVSALQTQVDPITVLYAHRGKLDVPLYCMHTLLT
ncbi:hypothetical protein K488DRAFT_64307, partial [Vararia minispora EC-137]